MVVLCGTMDRGMRGKFRESRRLPEAAAVA